MPKSKRLVQISDVFFCLKAEQLDVRNSVFKQTTKLGRFIYKGVIKIIFYIYNGPGQWCVRNLNVRNQNHIQLNQRSFGFRRCSVIGRSDLGIPLYISFSKILFCQTGGISHTVSVRNPNVRISDVLASLDCFIRKQLYIKQSSLVKKRTECPKSECLKSEHKNVPFPDIYCILA